MRKQHGTNFFVLVCLVILFVNIVYFVSTNYTIKFQGGDGVIVGNDTNTTHSPLPSAFMIFQGSVTYGKT